METFELSLEEPRKELDDLYTEFAKLKREKTLQDKKYHGALKAVLTARANSSTAEQLIDRYKRSVVTTADHEAVLAKLEEARTQCKSLEDNYNNLVNSSSIRYQKTCGEYINKIAALQLGRNMLQDEDNQPQLQQKRQTRNKRRPKIILQHAYDNSVRQVEKLKAKLEERRMNLRCMRLWEQNLKQQELSVRQASTSENKETEAEDHKATGKKLMVSGLYDLVVAKSTNICAELMTNPKFVELQKQRAAQRSSTHGGSTHQREPVKVVAIVRSKPYESKRKVASFTTDDMPQQVSTSENKEAEAEDHNATGKKLMVSGLYGLAVKEYSKAIALNPTQPSYFDERGIAYGILEMHNLCIPDMERAIELDSTYGKAYGALAMEYHLLGMLRKANATFQKALTFDPENELFAICLADVKNQLNAAKAQAEKPVSPVVDPSSTSSTLEYKKPQYDPSMVKAAKRLLQDPGARNIVAAMFETNTVEENVVIELFLYIRKDIDPTRFETVYKYPLEHTLEEYAPPSKSI